MDSEIKELLIEIRDEVLFEESEYVSRINEVLWKHSGMLEGLTTFANFWAKAVYGENSLRVKLQIGKAYFIDFDADSPEATITIPHQETLQAAQKKIAYFIVSSFLNYENTAEVHRGLITESRIHHIAEMLMNFHIPADDD